MLTTPGFTPGDMLELVSEALASLSSALGGLPCAEGFLRRH